MARRVKLINNPSDLVPLLQIFTSREHKQVFDKLFEEWMTETELDNVVKGKSKESLGVLRGGGLIESRWRTPKPSEKPVEEYHSSYSNVMANFQCSLDDLGNLIMISFMSDAEVQEIASKIVEAVKAGNNNMVDLSRVLKMKQALIRGIAKRDSSIVASGQRVKVVDTTSEH